MARRLVEASRRAEIVALVNEADTEREVADVAVDELCEAFEAEVAFILVTRPGRGERETIGQTGMSAAQAEAATADPLCRGALGSQRAVVHRGDDLLGLGAHRLALSPWTGGDGRQLVIGVARLYDEDFEAAEIAALEAVTTSVGHALERAWLGAERDRYAARQAALARSAKLLSSSLVARDVMETLSSEVRRAFEADVSLVYARGEGGELEIVAGAGIPPEALGHSCERSSGLCAEVVRAGETRLCQPFESRAPVELPGVPPLKSGAASPIRLRGAVEGLVLVAFHGDRWLELEEVELLGAFAELGGIASGNAADHAAAQRAAAHDSLTGCLNHGAFQDRLREEIARAARNGSTLAVVLLDLDHFKAVNDTFGHLAGDAVLRGTADALRESVRAYDQVARYGGDEFALLLPNTDEETARGVVDRARRAIARVQLPGTASVSAGAGIAHWHDHEDATSLIARADRALLDVKRARQRLSTEPEDLDGGAAGRDRERDRLRRLATAGSVGTRLGRLLDQRSIAETAVLELTAALGYERCVLARLEDDGQVTVIATGSERVVSDPAPGDAPTEPREAAAVASPTLLSCLRERRTVLGGEDGRGSSAARAELAVPVYAGSRLWGAIGVALGSSGGSGPDFDDDDAEVVQTVADHLGAALHTAELYERLDRTHLGTAEALAAAMEAKDRYTADHAHSIAHLAVAVGQELGLDDEALRDLRYGAIFHDIGKIAIPDDILNKPGPLTESELDVIRRHPAVGEQILAPVPFLSEVRQIVRHDHERWDGGGYPDGLREEEIPLGARVVLVVDAYHAMRSNRPYRAALGADAARTELLRHAGTQFDPRVVEALLVVLQRQAQVQEV